MMFAKRVFQVAGVYGLIIIALGYANFFYEGGGQSLINNTRVEYVHGFFLVAFAWQVAFLIIASDPVRYRMLMLAAMLEKFPFTLAVLALYALGDVGMTLLILGLIDGFLGVLFSIAYVMTDSDERDDADIEAEA